MDQSTQTGCDWCCCTAHQCLYATIDDQGDSDSVEPCCSEGFSVNEDQEDAVEEERGAFQMNQSSLSDLMNEINLAEDSDNQSSTSSSNGIEYRLIAGSEEDYPPPYTVPSDNLPWPKLLQYLRESESESSKYFSVPSNNGIQQSTGQKELDASCLVTVTEPNEEYCQFCGETVINLPIKNDEPEFCCNEQRDFCILKALFTKKMMEDKIKKMPGKIPIGKDSKVKKSPEERALERIRKKIKWEENKRNKLRMLETSNIHSVPRQARLIHFSLASPTFITKEWTKRNITAKQRKIPLPVFPARLPPLFDDVQEDKRMKELRRDFKIQTYNTCGQLSVVSLPDGTGHWYYPSGNVAMVIVPLYPYVMSCVLFEDKPKGKMIGYFDELGRSWLNKEEKSIRFICNPSEIVIFDYHGRIKRLHWADSYSLNNFLPLVFKPNRYLCIKYSSQDDVTISLATEQQQQYKLKTFKKSATELKVPSVIDKQAVDYSMQLEKLKFRFRSHLDCFEKATKLLKTTNSLPNVGNQDLVKLRNSKKEGLNYRLRRSHTLK